MVAKARAQKKAVPLFATVGGDGGPDKGPLKVQAGDKIERDTRFGHVCAC